jgi:type II secretory pathway pseudopilin PulG
MGTRGQKSGLTLIEMLAVLAIIMLLVGMLAGVAARITTQGKERLTRDTIALIGNALEQFRDFDYQYKDAAFAEFDFPLDCNYFSPAAIQTTFASALAATVALAGGTHDPNFSGSEGLYFFLSQVPSSRTTIDKVDKTLLTDKDRFGNRMTITITTLGGVTVYPLLRFIDPWGTALRYDYYFEVAPPQLPNPAWKRTFPEITSAGPDRRFGTNDDISNIQAK